MAKLHCIGEYGKGEDFGRGGGRGGGGGGGGGGGARGALAPPQICI